MNSRLQKQITIDATWLIGALALGGLALGGTIKNLYQKRDAVGVQRSSLSLKETRLTDEISARERLTDLTVAKARLEEADAMVADEARRISLISDIAAASNMRITSLGSGAARPTADAAVLARRHELVAVGEFRDLAVFIDALQRAEGAVAIEALQIGPFRSAAPSPTRRRNRRAAEETPEPEPDDDRLRVSLEIIWLGVSADFDALREAK